MAGEPDVTRGRIEDGRENGMVPTPLAAPHDAAIAAPNGRRRRVRPRRSIATLVDIPSPESVRADLRDAVEHATEVGPAERIAAIASTVPPATLADALAGLPAVPLRTVLAALGPERLADVVAALDPAAAAGVLLRLTRPAAADVLEAMAPDDAADVVGELREEDAPVAEQLLGEMTAGEAADVRQLLLYPPDTAGGIMTTDFIAVRPTDSVGTAVRRIRAPLADEVPPESASYVYVTEPSGRLAGVVPWHRLVRAGERVPVSALMEPQTITILATADQETVARAVREHRLLAAPVVDTTGRLLGIVTADDVADVVEEETTEDIERLGGSQPLEEPYLRAGPLTLVRKRVVWLLLLFLGATYTGSVLRLFSAELEQTVALAFFIPLLIGTGGNAGSQTVMTVIRALAIGEIAWRDLYRVWVKEASVGLLLGGIMGVVTLGRALLLGVGPDVGIAVAIAAGVIVLWAATVAAILPLLLHRLKIDPAVVSAPLITTLVDGTGLFLYLQIARYLLRL
ncbi:MAG: magnesium transporter [Chloroflexi bacterium]|nr:magnesium transporter [Chloroflexota bacterium]